METLDILKVVYWVLYIFVLLPCTGVLTLLVMRLLFDELDKALDPPKEEKEKHLWH